jgi:hypothetical protein
MLRVIDGLTNRVISLLVFGLFCRSLRDRMGCLSVLVDELTLALGYLAVASFALSDEVITADPTTLLGCLCDYLVFAGSVLVDLAPFLSGVPPDGFVEVEVV